MVFPLIKFTLKSILEKKMRTFLIILSISLSVALTFASISMKGTIMNLFEEQIKQFMGNAEIMVTAGENSPGPWVRLQELSGFEDRVDYQVGVIESSGTYEANDTDTYNINLKGYHLEDLAVMNPVRILESVGEGYAGKSIIIGEKDAIRLGVALGDVLKIEIGGTEYPFTIDRIAASEGLLRESMGNSITAVVPPGSLQKINGIGDRYSMLLIRSLDGVDDIKLIEDLQKVYNRFEVDDPIPEEEIESMLNNIIIPFLVMIMLVVVISIFIIYTSFKVITQEKIPALGTFRSIGATKKITDWILLIESVIYGIVGGIIGSGLGILVLKGIIFVLSMDPSGSGQTMEIELAYGMGEFIIAMGMAVVLSVISSVIPILQVSKLALRDVVLGNIQTVVKTTPWKCFVGLGLLVLPFIFSRFDLGPAGILIHGAGMVLMVFGIVLLVPYFTKVMAVVLEKVFGVLFGNLGLIGVKNIRENKSILNNISLLAIGIGGILMINHVSYSVGIEVVDVYNSVQYDIDVYAGGGNRSLEQRLRTVEGVEDTLGVYKATGVKEVSQNFDIYEVYGVNPDTYFDYWAYAFTEPAEVVYERLRGGDNIVVTVGIKDRFNLEIGDPFTIKYGYPKEKEVTYTVAGFANTLMNNGRIAFVPLNILKRDTGIKDYSQIFVRTLPGKDPEEVVEAMKTKFKRDDFYIQSINEMKKMNNAANAQIFGLLTGFSAVAMLIGIFGIFNNFLVSMMSRRRQFAMMRSVGLSRRQMRQLLFTEAFSSGLVGGTVGVLTGLLMVISVGLVLISMDLPVAMHYNMNMFVTAFISGGIISVLANLLPSIKTSKMNIIEAIKYE